MATQLSLVSTENTNNACKTSSLDFLNNIINPCRKDAEEKPLRNSELIRKIEDECDDLGGLQIFSNPTGTDMKFYYLTNDQMMLVGMRESKAVRKNVLEKIKALSTPNKIVPKTNAQWLAHLANEMAEQEALLLAHKEELKVVKEEISSVGSKIQDIQDKLVVTKSLREQTPDGWIPIHEGYQRYCNCVSYDAFKEFAWVNKMPMKPVTYTPANSIVRVDTYIVEIEKLKILKDHIIRGARKISKCYYEHDDMVGKFRLKD